MHNVTYRFGDFQLDAAWRELRHRDALVSLPPKSFDCLVYLIEHRERAVGRDELISAVWGRVDVSDALVAQTLLRARRAVGDTGSGQTAIRTVPRFGYRWVAPVEITLEPVPGETAVPVSVVGESGTSVEPATNGQIAFEPPAHVAGTSDSSSVRGKRRTPAVAIAIAIAATASLALAAWFAVGGWRGRTPMANEGGGQALAIVLPVEIAPGSAEYAWVRLGAMDYIASRLRLNGGMRVLPSEQVLQLTSDRKGIDEADFAQRLRATAGARWVLLPQASRGDRDWTLRLHLIDADGSQDVEAHGDTPLAAAAAATDALLRRLGRMRTDAAPAPTALVERLQQIDAELLAGQLANARALIQGAEGSQRNDPQLRLREGQVEFRAGRVEESVRSFTELLARGGSVPDEVRAQASMGLGAAAIRSGDSRQAEQRYSEALAILDRDQAGTFDPILLGNAYNGRGVARLELGREADAVADIGRARLAMQRAGNELEAASVDTNLGILESRRGNEARALQQFDRAAATFERFGVEDNLAATLQAKARSQLRLAQPAAALASITRAAAHIDQIENPILADRIGLVHVEVSLANGRLREADAWIARLRARPRPEPLAALDPLRLRLRLVRGDVRGAVTLAQQLVQADEPADGDLVLLGVQAALRAGDPALAQAWLARADAKARASVPWSLAQALLVASGKDAAAAERAFAAADTLAGREGTPDARLDVDCAHAGYLIEHGLADRAGAIVGEFGALADNDYRVARTTLALYRVLGESSTTARSEAVVQRLAGERDPSLPLVY